MVEILISDRKLARLCNSQAEQQKRLGTKGAKNLRSRLADLDAVARVTDLVAGHPHPLAGNRAGQFALRLDGGRRLVFEPAHEPVPLRKDGSIAWEQVTSIRIVFIGDYHD